MSNVVASISYGERGRILLVEDSATLASEAAELFIAAANSAVEERGIATIALSGGSTPKQMGLLLAQPEFSRQIPWHLTHIFWSDERWAPLESPDSNAGEARRNFLDHVPVPASNVHVYDIEAEDPAASAKSYESDVRSIVLTDNGVPRFDLIFLGMGEDGHTASLFPGTAALRETSRLVAPNDVPKLKTTRLTFTAPLINAARRVVFLAAGAGKATRLAEVLDGPIDVNELPSQIVRPQGGPLWLVDRAAISALSKQPES